MLHIIALSWNNSSCLCTLHVPSLAVLQPFMVLGSRRWRSSKESPTVYTGQFWNGHDCLFWYTRTLATQFFLGRLTGLKHQLTNSSSVQFRSVATFQCTQKDGEEEAVRTDWLRVDCVLHPEGRPGMSDVSPLSGILGLSFDSTLLSPLLFFCLVLLPFLSYRFLPAGPFF